MYPLGNISVTYWCLKWNMSNTELCIYSPSLSSKILFFPCSSPFHLLALPSTQLLKPKQWASPWIPSPSRTRYISILRCHLQNVTKNLTTTYYPFTIQIYIYESVYSHFLAAVLLSKALGAPHCWWRSLPTSLISSSLISPSWFLQHLEFWTLSHLGAWVFAVAYAWDAFLHTFPIAASVQM